MAKPVPARRKGTSSISLPKECEIDETTQTTPVKPFKPSRRAKQPIEAAAVDRRRQFTDEPASPKTRKK